MARPPKSQYQQLPGYARSIWDTRPDIRNALDQLELGVFRSAALLADQMLGDDRINGVLRSRVDALLSSPVEVKPASKKVKAQRVARELGGYEDDDGYEVSGGWGDMLGTDAMGRLVHWGLMLGIGVAQKRWTTTDSKWTPRLIPWHPQFLRWDWVSMSYKLMTANRGEIELPRLDDGAQLAADSEWVVWCPFGYQEGWKWSMVRWLADKYIIRQWSYRDWSRYGEAHGQPTKIAFVPANAPQDQKDAYFEELVAAHGEQVIMVPVGQGGREAGWGADMLEPTARTYDTFRLILEAIGDDIAIGVLGQNLTTNVQEGSRAAAQVHSKVALDKALFDAKIAPECLRPQVIVPWAKYNYGDPALAPIAKYCVEPAADETEEAATMKTAGEAGAILKQLTPKFDVDAFCERFAIPLRSDEELAASDQGALESLVLTPSIQGAIITVNEARAGHGLGPIVDAAGNRDPDGDLTITDFLQKHVPDQAAQVAGGIQGNATPQGAGAEKAKIVDAAKTRAKDLQPDDLTKLRAAPRGFVALLLARAGLTLPGLASLGVAFQAAPRQAPNGPEVMASIRGMLERAETMRLGRGTTLKGKARARLYGDRVTDKALRLATRALAPELAAYRDDIDAATSLPDLRARILRTHKGTDPKKLARVMEAARLMAYFGGRDSAARTARIRK